MASVQADLENVKRELAASSAALMKIEKEIEECFMQIRNFGSNPEATKNFTLPELKKELEYLRDVKKGLIVANNILLGKEKSLIDKEKSLIDKNNILLETKKSLIDKEKSLIDESLIDERKLGLGKYCVFV